MPSDIIQWLSQRIIDFIVLGPVILLAVTIHEYAHARAALWFGDPTAKNLGRLTLNPLPHIDPFGAICLFIFHFGWAKPVPVNPRYFKNIRREIIIMSLAGPLANILAAFLVGMLIRYFFYPWQLYRMVLVCLLFINLGLGLFNLLPLPPLDGSHVLENSLPPAAAQKYREFGRYGFFILIGIFFLELYAHIGIFSLILVRPRDFLVNLFSGENPTRLLHLLR